MQNLHLLEKSLQSIVFEHNSFCLRERIILSAIRHICVHGLKDNHIFSFQLETNLCKYQANLIKVDWLISHLFGYLTALMRTEPLQLNWINVIKCLRLLFKKFINALNVAYEVETWRSFKPTRKSIATGCSRKRDLFCFILLELTKRNFRQ